MKRRRLFLALTLITVTGLGLTFYARRGAAAGPEVVTQTVSRGTIVSVIAANGTVEAVTTVQVGTQVSGTIQHLYADFNSIVKKGQVLARLEPSLFQAAVDQAQANLIRAEADLQRLRVLLADTEVKAERARELAERQLISSSDRETAEVNRQSAEAQLRSGQAQVTQARASLSQAQVNLQKTIIRSPIDGIVIARDVDVGQTVAASLQAPTLFVIAADLSQMQVRASIDEADLGAIRDGQPVTFRVDAHPEEVFGGIVTQIRLNPVIEQNVVTYATIIAAPNPELKLMPGMTATITVEVARRENVLRVPATALRFRPTLEVLEAFGSPPPADSGVPVGTTGANRPAPPNVNTLWIYDGGLHPATVRVGVSDGTFVEILDGPVEEGAQVAARVTMPAAGRSTASPASGPASNPLMAPTQPRRR